MSVTATRTARWCALRLRSISSWRAPIRSRVSTSWEGYLAPWINDIVPGITVALKPRYGAYLVAAWLGGIIIDLLTYSGCYDIALRDFGLMLGALTLARLASKYDPPGLNVRL